MFLYIPFFRVFLFFASVFHKSFRRRASFFLNYLWMEKPLYTSVPMLAQLLYARSSFGADKGPSQTRQCGPTR